MSCCEALWRIFKFQLHGQSPAVKHLPVHLEDHHVIRYEDNADLQEALDEAKDTSLMAWFKLNESDPEAQSHIYPEIPKYYTWNANQWKKRKAKRNIITCMYFVHPKDCECFCLHLLLTQVKGATSFEDLQTVPHPQDNARSITYNTFQEVALAHDLLDDDQEWTNLLQEAIIDQMPHQLHHIFAWIVCHCNPSDPLQLWLQFARDLSLDYVRQLCRGPPTQEAPDAAMELSARNAALSDINLILTEMGSNLATFPELLTQFTGEDINQGFNEVMHQEPAPVNNHALLNQGQCAAFDRIIDALDSPAARKKLFFIDRPEGTGKSFLYNTLIAHILAQQQEIIAVTSSGIASLILHGGCTAHSTFKIPLKVDGDSTCDIPTMSALADRIRDTAAIIWDEAPMTN